MRDLEENNKPSILLGTSSLFFSLLLITVAAPLFSALTYFGYLYLSDATATRADIRRLALFTWLVTLFALTVFALRHRRKENSIREVPRQTSSAERAQAWEGRESRRLIRRVSLYSAIGLCCGAIIAMSFGSSWFLALNAEKQHQLIGATWLGGMILFLLIAVRISRSRLVFKNKPAPEK